MALGDTLPVRLGVADAVIDDDTDGERDELTVVEALALGVAVAVTDTLAVVDAVRVEEVLSDRLLLRLDETDAVTVGDADDDTDADAEALLVVDAVSDAEALDDRLLVRLGVADAVIDDDTDGERDELTVVEALALGVAVAVTEPLAVVDAVLVKDPATLGDAAGEEP